MASPAASARSSSITVRDLRCLSAMDRHVIANMGAELGATTTVFPSDEETRRFLATRGPSRRLARNQPPMRDAVRRTTMRSICRSSNRSSRRPRARATSSGVADRRGPRNLSGVYRLFGQSRLARLCHGGRNRARTSHPGQALVRRQSHLAAAPRNLIADGRLGVLVAAGARIHQTGCNGCIGMGQAPAIGRNSLRTTPRNFPGRSGTNEDSVFLCSPETAAASALTGRITDPRSLAMSYPRLGIPRTPSSIAALLQPPPPPRRRGPPS